MNSEIRSSIRTSVRTKDDLSKYSSYIANKAKLVAIMKSNESIKIKNSSFLHLHSMIESKPDDICESVNFSIITTITSTETKHVSKVYTEEKEEVYCKLLSYVKYFHIYDTIYTTKTEEEKALNEIPIANAKALQAKSLVINITSFCSFSFKFKAEIIIKLSLVFGNP